MITPLNFAVLHLTAPKFLWSLVLTIIEPPLNSFKHGSTHIIFCLFLHCTLSSQHLLCTILWYIACLSSSYQSFLSLLCFLVGHQNLHFLFFFVF
jgi:hypothetical protein